ncbi:MAG: type IV secretion protein DotN [Alphaproteobacteria bacterium]|nr:type IV secretion protein DotN [Alphaproteobacteria bacterium]
MSLLPLTLGVGSTFGAGGEGPVGALSKAGTEKILARDDFTCRFCGFRSRQYQRVVPVEGGYATACGFCEQTLNLERAGVMGSGVLIWLPEITQAELNHIARAIYVARAEEGGEMADVATRALNALTARRIEAKKRLGSDDPFLLATVLHENLNNRERPAAIAKLEGIRLLPLDKYMVRSQSGNVNGFPKIVKFWRSPSGPFAQLPTGEWKDMFKKIAA